MMRYHRIAAYSPQGEYLECLRLLCFSREDARKVARCHNVKPRPDGVTYRAVETNALGYILWEDAPAPRLELVEA